MKLSKCYLLISYIWIIILHHVLCYTCTPGRYGEDCKENCGHCENNMACHHINGSCPGSCEPGYHGEKCLTNKLVRPGFTWAISSSFAYGGYPNKTVDGDFRQNHYTFCMHTEPRRTEAWLMIGLKKIYNIHSVKFWYRNDSLIPGYNTRRMQGFSIRLSNTTQTDRQDICYQDDGKTTLPPIIERQCKGVAQYVWIYTNKTFYDGALLEICEVQVYGCSYQDSYGNCIPCDQCKNDCMINGECDNQGCKSDRFPSPYCKECREGFYGRSCSHVCGHCAKQAVCDQVNGSCPSGYCDPGWKNELNQRCNKECDDGSYGLYCTHKCGYCSKGVSCNKVDGSCLGGCEDGWANLYCNDTCEKGMYGRNCTRTCGHCLNKATCNHVTGSCPSGICEPGWKHTFEQRCNQECDDGSYGLYCTQKCGYCAKGVSCNKVDGSCLGGCEDGWANLYCNDTCKKGLYGRNCSRTCGHCLNKATCNHVTGSCPSGICEPGWKHTFEQRCNQACNNGMYGKNCARTCGHCLNKATCNHVTGSCPSGLCEPGWKHTLEKRCNQECDGGTFGYNCSYNCSGHCAGGFPCSRNDGICIGGCEDGWTNYHCNETCRHGLYGKNCASSCGQCLNNSTCHHVTGSCPSGLCAPGWKHTPEKRCNQVCNDGWYGRECKQRCGYCRGNKPCHHVTGSCSGLCEPGYSGDKCTFSEHLANQREMIKLMREFLANKRRKIDLRYNGTSPTDF